MKVALDTTFAGVNPTGVGIYSKRLVESLIGIARSHGFSLNCYGPSCPGERRQRLLGGIYQEWPTYTQAFLPLKLAKYRPDVIHSTSHIGPLWGPGRRVVTVHDLIFRRYPGDYNPLWLAVTRAMLPKVLKGAAAIIADSQTTRADLMRYYGVPDGKVAVIYPGVDDAFRTPVAQEQVASIRRKLGVAGGAYILCLGPWVRRKQIETVIEAFSLLAERLPCTQLVITGRPSAGMGSSGVAETLGKLPGPIRERVHTVGHLPVEDLRALLQGAAALAYPSRFEGFGLPPIEAMAAGVPVVASDAAAVVEATGGAALIARAGEPRDWADALHQVLSDSAKAAELKAAGLKRSRSFTWDRCARQTANLYSRIMNFEL